MSYDIGVQTYTYREFDVDGIVEAIEDLRVDVVEITGTHLAMDDDPAAVDRTIGAFEDLGADVVGWSCPTPEEPGDAEEILAFAGEYDIEYLNIDFDPADVAVAEALEAAGERHGVNLGLHNHGPDPWSEFRTVDDVLGVVGSRAPCMGACVDTGHFFRVDERPADVIPALEDRIHAVHVKDFVDAETEVVPGDSNLDMSELLDLLDEHVSSPPPLVVEYEEDPDDPTAGVRTALDRLEAAGA